MPPFEECMQQCKEYFELGVRSKFDEAIEKLGKWSSFSIYHESARMNLSTLKHMLTLNKVNFKKKYFYDSRMSI